MNVVTTALRILEAVAARQPVGVTEIAKSLELPKTTAHRGLKALEAAGWVRAVDGEPTRWSLTTRLLEVARHTSESGGLRDAVMGTMERLRQATQETIHLAVLEGDRMVVVERLDSPMVVRSSYPLGFSAPVQASSTGKAILSCLSADEVKSLLPTPLHGFTETTVTDLDALLVELAEVRQQGYATNHGELRPDIGSVAAPVRNVAGRPVAAISVSAPIQRIQEAEEARWGELVATQAAAVTTP